MPEPTAVSKLFWNDPYRRSCRARVVGVDGEVIRIDRTVFFAFSGGQESDRGSIGGIPVISAERRGRQIDYRLPADHGLSIGDDVEVLIDWDRRYRLMRLHFAAELVLETIYRTFPGIEKTGAHIAEHGARLDFRLEEPITPYLDVIAARVSRIIDADQPVVSAFEDEETDRRYWEINSFARVPCGGTHLKRTGEVGLFGLKRNNIGKGRERVEVTLL